MRKLGLMLIVLVVIVASLGFYRGWFTLSGGRESNSNKVDVNLSLDTDKVKRDAEIAKEKATELADKAKEAVTDYGDNAGADVKPKQD